MTGLSHIHDAGLGSRCFPVWSVGKKKGNCLVQSRPYALIGNRDLERDFLSQDLLSGLAIAIAIRSFDPSLFAQLIPLELLEAGAQCAPYKCTIQTDC